MTRFRFTLANLMCVPVLAALLCVLYRGQSYLEALPLVIPVIGLVGLMFDRGSGRPFFEGFIILGTVYPVIRAILGAGWSTLDKLLAVLYLGRQPVAFELYTVHKNWVYFQAGGHVVIAAIVAIVGGCLFIVTRRLHASAEHLADRTLSPENCDSERSLPSDIGCKLE